jgi:MFS family permease
MTDAAREEIVDRERRRRPYVLAAGIGAFVLLFAGQAIQGSGLEGDTDAENLIARSDAFGSLLGGAIVAGLGLILIAAPIAFLYSAAFARSEQMRPGLGPLIPLGAILLAVSGVMQVFAYDSIASDFVGGTPIEGDEGETRAEDLISESGLYGVAGFLGIAGLFALAVGTFYASTHALRTGLLTRFWATLGMALSVMAILTPIFGPIGLIGLFLWTLLLGLQMSGRWPGGLPPAWDAGEAIPWPQPGQAPPPGPAEEPASPEDFEGSATEVEESERPGRRDNRRKRKRKAR